MATWPNIIDDDGSGTTGTVLDDALFDQVKLYIDAGVAGGVTPVPFNAANFIPTAGTWTVASGNVLTNSYVLAGPLVVWSVSLFNTATSAGNSAVYINMPFMPTQRALAYVEITINGAIKVSSAVAIGGTLPVTIRQADGQAIAAGNLAVAFTIAYFR